jgi:hypothetical protein
LIGKSEGRRPLGSPTCGREDNNKMYLKVVECSDLKWIYLAQDRDQWWAFLSKVMNFRVLYETGNVPHYLKTIIFSP